MMTFREVYKTLVFWTLKDQSFYCLEPWTAPGNALNTGQDLIHLPAGSHLEARVTFGVTLSPG
jgi:galactose mutarotase-like enzyme